MTETRSAVLTGGCQCGAVRYALYRSPVNPHICHCRTCQKAMGSPKLFKSSTIVTRGFCGDCGTPLWFRFEGDTWIGFTLGSLDDPDQVPPTRAFGAESKRRWFDGLHNLPHLTTDSVLDAEM
ncbi:MAG: aldehyde-activating protein [Rhodospirillaceae bacterium]|nr:aldehyde-activating protein [Rhodospirillaceae bacterium]|tara:strand:+ start:13133 stop:13501 length:369 start_codon:yes stop_codon:yes gene_type:complete